MVYKIVRYLILYHIGGLYVDFDYQCIRPLDVLLADSTCCMGMEPTINSCVYNKSLIVGNALMASAPKHPYMAAIIKDMKANFSVDYKKGESEQILETNEKGFIGEISRIEPFQTLSFRARRGIPGNYFKTLLGNTANRISHSEIHILNLFGNIRVIACALWYKPQCISHFVIISVRGAAIRGTPVCPDISTIIQFTVTRHTIAGRRQI